eukprot:CAMPEP_0182889092 /NCGR_PEP_ID=MMETSP0034_2-20130328/21833_1 /TAXON_ID=156128 /ORGANISM="Nephroselmis pyriformis, Strain CCMP717" /LENGTH=196 /DNA_ID=CAMNT_0025022561 /DNA_START=100 /DNA_END=687 /DNA_ORIENTATION=-
MDDGKGVPPTKKWKKMLESVLSKGDGGGMARCTVVKKILKKAGEKGYGAVADTVLQESFQQFLQHKRATEAFAITDAQISVIAVGGGAPPTAGPAPSALATEKSKKSSKKEKSEKGKTPAEPVPAPAPAPAPPVSPPLPVPGAVAEVADAAEQRALKKREQNRKKKERKMRKEAQKAGGGSPEGGTDPEDGNGGGS